MPPNSPSPNSPQPPDPPTLITRAVNIAGDLVARDKHIHIGPLKIPHYLAAIITLCMIGILAFVAYPIVLQWLPRPPAFVTASSDETLIVIATFHVTAGNRDTLPHREIRNRIAEEAKTAGNTALRVEIEPTILTADQRADAETLGNRYNASMVIWGDDTGARITVNFLNLRQPDFDAASVTISETLRTQLANPSAYSQFIVDDLPRQLTFLTLFALGQSHYVNNDYPLAITNIEAAIASLPENAKSTGLADAYYGLGWLYQAPSSNNVEKAIAAYDQAIAIDPVHLAAYGNRGLVFTNQGKLAEAIADFDKVIALDPNGTLAYNNRGIAYFAQGKLEQAIANFNQAIALGPGYALAYNNRGNALSDQGKLDEAIADYDQAIKLDPEYEVAYYNRGLAYYDQGKLDQAIADFDQAIALDPNYEDAYNNRGVAYYDQGKLDEASADYDKAIDLDPEYAPAYNNRGIANRARDKLDEAIADYNQAIALDPDYARAHNGLCWTYSLLSQPQTALPHCQKAIKLDPDPNFFDSRGLAYALLGDFPAAIADFQLFIGELEKQNDPTLSPYLEKRKAWIAALQSGDNPFIPELLLKLRHE